MLSEQNDVVPPFDSLVEINLVIFARDNIGFSSISADFVVILIVTF